LFSLNVPLIYILYGSQKNDTVSEMATPTTALKRFFQLQQLCLTKDDKALSCLLVQADREFDAAQQQKKRNKRRPRSRKDHKRNKLVEAARRIVAADRVAAERVAAADRATEATSDMEDESDDETTPPSASEGTPASDGDMDADERSELNAPPSKRRMVTDDSAPVAAAASANPASGARSLRKRQLSRSGDVTDSSSKRRKTDSPPPILLDVVLRVLRHLYNGAPHAAFSPHEYAMRVCGLLWAVIVPKLGIATGQTAVYKVQNHLFLIFNLFCRRFLTFCRFFTFHF
jgi:hypothetical protein